MEENINQMISSNFMMVNVVSKKDREWLNDYINFLYQLRWDHYRN